MKGVFNREGRRSGGNKKTKILIGDGAVGNQSLPCKENRHKDCRVFKSTCCDSAVEVISGDEGTSYWQCGTCHRPCNAIATTLPSKTRDSETNVDLPICEKCGATLLLFDEHYCRELEDEDSGTGITKEMIERSAKYSNKKQAELANESIKLDTLSSGFGHKDNYTPDLKEFDDKFSHRDIECIHDLRLFFISSIERARREGRQERELYKLGEREERQRVVETLKKLGIVDEETGTITFSYNELFDLFKDFPSDKETIPEGYIINPVEDGVAKYIKKKLEIKKWDKELCKIGKVVKEGE